MLFTDINFTRGSGLGNRLFPWARAKLFCRDHSARFIAPRWAHFRTASLRMGGIDYEKFLRKVLLWDNFRVQEHEVHGLEALWLSRRLEQLSENDPLPNEGKDTMVVFEGMRNHFQDISSERSFVSEQLFLSIKDKWKRYLLTIPQDTEIAINVRLGNDFKAIGHTPLDWYVDTLKSIRAFTGKAHSTIVVSDGPPSKLQPLISMPNVQLVATPAAVTDLFALTKAKLLIGSGGSSFTAWASFLGGMPTFIHPNSSLEYFKINHGNPGHYIGPPKELSF